MVVCTTVVVIRSRCLKQWLLLNRWLKHWLLLLNRWLKCWMLQNR
jgi:hypothetical protein